MLGAVLDAVICKKKLGMLPKSLYFYDLLNWQLITLFNVDYKISTKTISKRIRTTNANIVCFSESAQNSLAACILRDGLSTLADGVLCQFSGQEQPDGGLNLAGTDRGLLAVLG